MLYQNRKFVMDLPFTHNLLHLKGIDPFPDEYFRNFIDFRLFNYLPDSDHGALTYGDYVTAWGWNTNRGHVLLRMAAKRSGDGRAEWLAQRILENSGRSTWQAFLYTYEYFEYDPSIAPVSPGEPFTRLFPDLHAVVWRTGFDSDDVTFGLKSGPYGGEFFYNTFYNQSYPSRSTQP